MISSGCRTSVDARPPLRATYDTLYRRPDSDEAFLRSVTGDSVRRSGSSRRRWIPSRPSVVDSYSCRQMYLRSYTFTTAKKKDTVPERTRRCLGKVRDRAAVGLSAAFPVGRCGYQRRRGKKEGCVEAAARKLREASRTVVSKVMGRMFSCTTSVDVMGG